MRELASAELHIGGFTNVQLEHPVIDLSRVAEDEAASRGLVFFLAAALAAGAQVARVHAGRSPRAVALASLAKRQLRGAVARVDDDNLRLLRYFDVYLHPADVIRPATGERVVRLLGEALREPDP